MKKRDVILTTQAHRPAFDEFHDAMRSAENREGWRPSEVLSRFLDAGFRAVRGKLLFGERFDENERQYMAIVNRCQHPQETMGDMARMLGALQLAMIADPVDFIGPVFSVLSAESSWGQFFTPHHLSYMMAKMIVGEKAVELKDKPYLTLCEPACGVGGMVLATNVLLREQGFDIAKQAHWHMTDIDFRAVCAAYLQTAMSDCSAIVIRGNSLCPKPDDLTTPTPAAVYYPKRFAVKEEPLAVISPPEPAPAKKRAVQLSLFEEPV